MYVCNLANEKLEKKTTKIILTIEKMKKICD